jgi:sugar phosphate isomerase/epimerase
MQLSLLASTPDVSTTGYMVNLLLGRPEAVAAEAKALGYDGIELLPGAPGTVGVAEIERALKRFDVALTAVNSGRIVAQGLTLLHPVPAVRARALARFKDLLDLAGHFGVPVTLAGAKGMVPAGDSLVEGIRAAGGLLRHLHLYDPGRVPPGTSEKAGVDWSALMAALQDIQYDGAASVSLAPTGDRIALAIKTVSYLRSVGAR